MSSLKNISFNDPKVGYGLVFVGALALYVVSCAPGVLWQDSGMFQYRIWHNDIEGGLGLALSHPLYHIIGMVAKYIPFGDFAYRVNLISAVFGAFTIANIFLLVRLWFGRGLGALVAAMSLAFSWTFWQNSAIAEVYTLYTAIFTVELIFLLGYVKSGRVSFLYWLGFFNGLSIANHMWGVMPLACYGVFAVVLLGKGKIGFKPVCVMAILWVVGASSYEYLIIREMIESGDIAGTLASACFGDSWEGRVLNASLSWRVAIENVVFVVYSFATLNFVLFFVGLYSVYKLSPSRGFANIVLALLILFFVFAFRYTVPDRHVFFIPFYVLAAVLMGCGFEYLSVKFNGRWFGCIVIGLAFLPIGVYAAVPGVAEKVGFEMPARRTIPYRDDLRWFLQPWQGQGDGPGRFGREALEGVESDAVICADGTTVYAIWYIQTVLGEFGGVKVLSDHGSYVGPIKLPTEGVVEGLMAEGSVYVVSPVAGYCRPEFLLEKYDFERRGVLYRVVEK